MTDSEKLDKLYKMVSEIRDYIGSQPDCPQHLWSETRRALEVARQRAALNFGTLQQNATNMSPWGQLPEGFTGWRQS